MYDNNKFKAKNYGEYVASLRVILVRILKM